jgi:hypothetical protein
MGVRDWVNLGGTVLNGVLQTKANSDALDAINSAGTQANALQKYMYDTSRSDNEPWRTAGQAALANLTGLLNSGELSSRFAGKIDNEKGYQFARDEGLRAIDRKAAAGGGFGAGAQKAGIRFAEANANQFYNDAFNRWNIENTGTFNRLSGLAGTGQTANAQVGAAGSNYANQGANNLMMMGNAGAAAGMNQGNIYGNMLNQGLGYLNNNWWQNPQPGP